MTDTERKEVACYAIKRGNRIVAISPEKATCEALRHGDDESIVEGWFSTKRPQDNNALVDIDTGVNIIKDYLRDREGGLTSGVLDLYAQIDFSDIVNIATLFAKFGKDNNALPEPMDNGGYFGTHCHICHEAVAICKCVACVKMVAKYKV